MEHFFAHWLLSEALVTQGVAGAALIVLAAFVSNAATTGEDNSREKNDDRLRDEVR